MKTKFNGHRLKIQRDMKDLTQKELADKIKKSAITVFRYEKNERTPDAETLLKISKVLDCEMADFFH